MNGDGPEAEQGENPAWWLGTRHGLVVRDESYLEGPWPEMLGCFSVPSGLLLEYGGSYCQYFLVGPQWNSYVESLASMLNVAIRSSSLGKAPNDSGTSRLVLGPPRLNSALLGDVARVLGHQASMRSEM